MVHRVKLNTLITRINRRLIKDSERLCKARPYEARTLGDYYLMDRESKLIQRCRVEPVAFAAERGILGPDEVVEIEGKAEPVSVSNGPACRLPKARTV